MAIEKAEPIRGRKGQFETGTVVPQKLASSLHQPSARAEAMMAS